MQKLDKILYATDFSEGSEIAAEYALKLAKLYGAEIVVLHVISELADSNRIQIPDGDYAELEQDVKILAQQQMQQLCARHFSGMKYSERMEVGIPFKVIIEIAHSMSADLIVVGTHGRTGLAHVVLGSTAERLMRKAGLPVLTIPCRELP